MKEKPLLSVRLSAEELMLVLWLLNTPTLPGLGESPFAGWTEQEIQAALASAERSLRARRFLSKTPQGEIQMEQVVMALVGTCAAPDISIVLAVETPEAGRVVHYFHATSLMAVEHTNPEPGIHCFDALENLEAVQARLETLLALEAQPSPSASPAQLTLAVLQEATRAAAEGTAATQDVLKRYGLDHNTSTALAATLTQIRRRATLAVIHGLRKEKPHSDGMVILEGPPGLWVLQAEGSEPQSIVHLWPRSAGQCRQYLHQLIAGQAIQFAV